MKAFAEFFAGIGLVRAGLSGSGWQCAYANDIEPKKQRMYVDHFGESTEYHLADIWQTSEVLSRLPRDLTLATASFPCTDLSLAGHWRGIDAKHSSTFFAFIEVLAQLGGRKPRMIIVENVLGFVKSNSGRDFAKACKELAKLGYWLDAVIVDAKWFVPQSRPRVFIIAVDEGLRQHDLFSSPPRGDLFHLSPKPFFTRNCFQNPLQLQAAIFNAPLSTGWITAQLPSPPQRRIELPGVLENNEYQEWWPADAVHRHLDAMQEPSRRKLQRLISEDIYTVGTAFRRTRLGAPRTEVRFDVAGCLRTPRGGSARQIVIQVGRGEVRMRWMTAREYARLQGIGDFNIRVPEQQAMFGFGDAVCVPAIQWLDRHLLTPLYESTLLSTKKVNGHVLAS